MKGLKVLSRRQWITSHVFFILGLVLASICLHSILPPLYRWLATGAIWSFATGLCIVFSNAFAKLVAKE